MNFVIVSAGFIFEILAIMRLFRESCVGGSDAALE
jgi:hypothetical protein